MHTQHFGGDPYADVGFWSPCTSAANFCEEDYAITKYIAEFINCLSNLAYVYFAIQYSRPGLRNADLMAKSLFLVGVCSLAFHASLRQTAQFSDDISMLFLAGSLIQRLYCFELSAAVARLATTTIFAAIAGMSAFYVQSGNLLLHTSLFAGLLTLIWPRTLYLIYGRGRTADEKSKHFSRFKRAVGWLVLGFVLWNIDIEFCYQLRALRERIGLPFGWSLELHGWWHFLTALGAFEYMGLIRDLST